MLHTIYIIVMQLHKHLTITDITISTADGSQSVRYTHCNLDVPCGSHHGLVLGAAHVPQPLSLIVVIHEAAIPAIRALDRHLLGQAAGTKSRRWKDRRSEQTGVEIKHVPKTGLGR